MVNADAPGDHIDKPDLATSLRQDAPVGDTTPFDVHALLQAFMESTPDWLFAKDLEHRFLFVNRSIAAAVGTTPELMVGRCDTEFWGVSQCEPDPATGHPGFHADDRRAFAGETVHNHRDVATVADGTTHVFDTVKSPLRGVDGRIIGVLCYCRDVTERDRAAHALRDSEERFRALVANIPGSVYRSEIAPPYRDLFMSEGIRGISGYEAHEYMVPGGPQCGDLILPEDRASVNAGVAAAVAGRTPFHVQYRIRHRDGSIRWVSDNGRATYTADGTPLFLEGVHIDITESAVAESTLRERGDLLSAIVEAAPECVKMMDRLGHVLEMNPAGLRMVEADHLEQLRGRDVLHLIHPDHHVAFREMLKRVFSGDSRRLTYDIVGLRGARRTLETHSVPMWAPDRSEVRALLGMTRDITEQLRSDAARQVLEAQLRQSQKMQAIGTLAGGIAHDFNNVLTGILGHAELLERQQIQPLLTPDEVRSSIAGILAAAKRARDLVQQIQTFSRRGERPRQAIHLRTVVSEALQMLRAALPASIDIRTDFSCKDSVVLADPTQLHQVVVNLCTNAAHAMRDRGGTLEVRSGPALIDEAFCQAHPGMRPGPHATLTVRDTGHGMEPDVLERIFEPFFTTKKPGEGVGIGMSVVHGIVQNHDGAIAVESRPGEGTSVVIWLPTVATRVETATAAPRDVPRGHGEHVLVVDDEHLLINFAKRALTGLGYRVTAHQRPEAAMAELERDPAQFDLVLCDLTMPMMNGLDFAEHVHRLRPDLPVLLTSGFLDDLDEVALHRSNVRELLGKPFLIEDLAEALGRHIGTRN